MGLFDFFRRKPSLAELDRDIERMLMKKVPAKIGEVKAKGPFYCLLLCYCAEDVPAGWPPFLLLGCETERQRIIASGDHVTYYLWAPDEMRNQKPNIEIPLHQDKTVNDACQRHLEALAAVKDYEPAITLLKKVAKALNRHDWSDIIPVTSDFVVAAVDNTCDVEPVQDIREVVPDAKLRSLRDQGLI